MNFSWVSQYFVTFLFFAFQQEDFLLFYLVWVGFNCSYSFFNLASEKVVVLTGYIRGIGRGRLRASSIRITAIDEVSLQRPLTLSILCILDVLLNHGLHEHLLLHHQHLGCLHWVSWQDVLVRGLDLLEHNVALLGSVWTELLLRLSVLAEGLRESGQGLPELVTVRLRTTGVDFKVGWWVVLLSYSVYFLLHSLLLLLTS